VLGGRYLRVTQGFIFCFDITDEESFKEVEKNFDGIKGGYLDDDVENVPIILVGTKSDLEDQRKVQFEQGQELAMRMKLNCPYIETSSKIDRNVKETFEIMIQQLTCVEEKRKRDKKRNVCLLM